MLMHLGNDNECDSWLAHLPAVPRFQQCWVAELPQKTWADVLSSRLSGACLSSTSSGRNKPAILSAAVRLILLCASFCLRRFRACAVYLLVHYQRMESVRQINVHYPPALLRTRVGPMHFSRTLYCSFYCSYCCTYMYMYCSDRSPLINQYKEMLNDDKH